MDSQCKYIDLYLYTMLENELTNSDIRDLQKIEPQDRKYPGGGQLVWVPPGYELAAEPTASQPKESHLWDYIWLIWRGRWIIAFVFLVCVGIAALQMYRSTPIYIGSAKLSISSRVPQIVEFQGSERRDDSASVGFIESQMLFIRSRTLGRKVVEELNLYSFDDQGGKGNKVITPTPTPAPSFYAKYLKSFIHKPSPEIAAPKSPKDIAEEQMARRVRWFLQGLSVTKIPNTEIVTISYMDPDPVVCAKVANAVCDAYMTLNYQTQTNSYEYASKWIDQKLYEVKANLEKSEEKLYELGGGQDALALVEGAEKSSAKIEKMNQDLADAEREVHDKLFMLESIRKGARPNDLLSSGSQGSARVESLKSELEKLDVEYAKSLQQFGPAMAQVKALKAAKGRLETQIAKERKQSTVAALANAQFEYDQAQSKRDFLRQDYDKQKERMLAVQQRLIKYNILKREVEVNKDLYNSLLQRSREVGVTSGLKAGNVAIIETAEVPRTPALPDKRRTILLGAMIGLLLGIGLVFFREYMDTTIRGALDVQKYCKTVTLGLLPHLEAGRLRKFGKMPPETISATQPRSIFAENVRQLRTAVQYSLAGYSPKTIMVTSALPSEGKTTVAANLAIALAQAGGRTILIDADLKKPTVHKFFNVDRGNGLTDILTGKSDGNFKGQLFKTETDNLYVIPSGARAPNPVDLLNSIVMRRVLSTLAEHFDHVILDCPPTLDLSDTSVLFRQVDGVIIVAKPGKTPRSALMRVSEKVHGFGGHLLGVVLNDRKARTSKRYGYGDGYAYMYGGGGEELAALEK